ARAVEQRHAALLQGPAQILDRRLVLVQFTSITGLELVPASRNVPAPLAELGARRDVLEPEYEIRLVLAYAARPDTVDQNSLAVVRCRRLVDALHPDVHGTRSSAA